LASRIPEIATNEAPAKAAIVRQCKILEKMRGNPKGDWDISDIQRACRQLGVSCQEPSRGTHFKISSEHIKDVLTIPAHRPIKPVYIKLFVSFADAHVRMTKEDKNG